MANLLNQTWIFVLAGLAGSSGWLFVHPFDVVKVQMQIDQKASASIAGTFKAILANEGFRGLYAGLEFALWRQCTYTTLRMGLYDTLLPLLVADRSGQTSAFSKAFVGVIAGAIGAAACCPVDVGLVRAQADARAPAAERRNYKGCMDALRRISAEEGMLTLWRGVGPTVARGAVVSMTQLASYDQAKEMLPPLMGTGFPLVVSSALVSAIIYCSASLPLDIAKTRIQNMRPDASGAMPYNGLMDCLFCIPREEGFLALWKGFPAYCLRSGGYTIGLFLFKEQYAKMYCSFMVWIAAAPALFDEGTPMATFPQIIQVIFLALLACALLAYAVLRKARTSGGTVQSRWHLVYLKPVLPHLPMLAVLNLSALECLLWFVQVAGTLHGIDCILNFTYFVSSEACAKRLGLLRDAATPR